MRLFLALVLASLGVAYAADRPKRTGTVDVDRAAIMSGPAFGYPSVGEFRKGDSVLILREEDTGFYAIQPPPGSVSWIKAIHLGKVDLGDSGKANVTVTVEGAEVMAGETLRTGPTNRLTTRLARGTIVEVIGMPKRIDNASWCPITPPEGDMRWVSKKNVSASSVTVLAGPTPYEPKVTEATPAVAGPRGNPPITPAVATTPRSFTEHRLYDQAVRAEKAGDFTTAKGLYARIYQDLWDQKADRDAIISCYNRYQTCDERSKGTGETKPPVTRAETASRSAPTNSKWSSAGTLQEMQKVFVDGQQVYSLIDDRGEVINYATGVDGVNLRSFTGKRVQLLGAVQQRPELFRPHIAVERVEIAR